MVRDDIGVGVGAFHRIVLFYAVPHGYYRYIGLAVSKSAIGISGNYSRIFFAASALTTPSLLKGTRE